MKEGWGGHALRTLNSLHCLFVQCSILQTEFESKLRQFHLSEITEAIPYKPKILTKELSSPSLTENSWSLEHQFLAIM